MLVSTCYALSSTTVGVPFINPLVIYQPVGRCAFEIATQATSLYVDT
jgi:hypothetical protein